MTTTLRLSTKAAALVPHPHPALLALAASAALLVPGILAAQLALTPARVEVTALATTTRDNARADTLEELGARYSSTPGQWQKAARYFEQAATLRGDDGRAVTNLVTAASLYDAAGNSAHARSTMERAAKRAAAMGDVERAANAYVDAAFLAVAAKRIDLVPKLLRQTHAVLDSPKMPPERRDAILRRIGDESRIAEVAKRP